MAVSSNVGVSVGVGVMVGVSVIVGVKVGVHVGGNVARSAGNVTRVYSGRGVWVAVIVGVGGVAQAVAIQHNSASVIKEVVLVVVLIKKVVWRMMKPIIAHCSIKICHHNMMASCARIIADVTTKKINDLYALTQAAFGAGQ